MIDGFHSKWWVWNEVVKDIQQMNKYIQIYMEKIKEGKKMLLCICAYVCVCVDEYEGHRTTLKEREDRSLARYYETK